VLRLCVYCCALLQSSADFNWDRAARRPLRSSIPVPLPAALIKVAQGASLSCEDCYAYYDTGLRFEVSELHDSPLLLDRACMAIYFAD
jgi:hypothetical protein